MPQSLTSFVLTRRLVQTLLPLFAACGSSGAQSDPNGASAGASGMSTDTAGQGTGGMAVGGGLPTSGSSGTAAGSSSGGSDGGMTAGGTNTGGTASAGMPQGGGTAGAAEAGSAGTMAGGGAAGDSAGTAGTNATAGTGGSNSDLHGGASAKFVCDPNATYGDPLMDMGAVQTISPPTMGDVTYFAFIEGPVWVGSLGTLFFSDNSSSPEERIWKIVPPSSTPEVFMEGSGSNGLAIDNDDQLILADQRMQRIVRADPETAMVTDTLVAAGNYKPNDLIVRSDDNIYFTDPDSAGRGFYRVSPEGELSPAMTEVSAPNGIVLSPDENTLYVGDVQNRTITSFSLAADGGVDLASQALFATTTGRTLDGMAVDCAGNLYAGTAEGVEVFNPSGEPLGTVPTGESSNATFGGADRKTLYVTSRAVLKSVTLAVPGLPD